MAIIILHGRICKISLTWIITHVLNLHKGHDKSYLIKAGAGEPLNLNRVGGASLALICHPEEVCLI